MSIALCIFNKVTKKFVFHVVPETPKELTELADKLGIPDYYNNPHEFTEYAVKLLTDDKMDVWSQDNFVPSNDPWDDSKELRSQHFSVR